MLMETQLHRLSQIFNAALHRGGWDGPCDTAGGRVYRRRTRSGYLDGAKVSRRVQDVPHLSLRASPCSVMQLTRESLTIECSTLVDAWTTGQGLMVSKSIGLTLVQG